MAQIVTTMLRKWKTQRSRLLLGNERLVKPRLARRLQECDGSFTAAQGPRGVQQLNDDGREKCKTRFAFINLNDSNDEEGDDMVEDTASTTRRASCPHSLTGVADSSNGAIRRLPSSRLNLPVVTHYAGVNRVWRARLSGVGARGFIQAADWPPDPVRGQQAGRPSRGRQECGVTHMVCDYSTKALGSGRVLGVHLVSTHGRAEAVAGLVPRAAGQCVCVYSGAQTCAFFAGQLLAGSSEWTKKVRCDGVVDGGPGIALRRLEIPTQKSKLKSLNNFVSSTCVTAVGTDEAETTQDDWPR